MIRITKALVGHGTLLRGPGYLSNTHWLIRNRVVGPCRLKAAPRKERIRDLIKPRRRVRVWRTGRTSDLPGGDRAVLFSNKPGTVRAWVLEAYADGLGFNSAAFAVGDRDAVTNAAKNWTVAVMPEAVWE